MTNIFSGPQLDDFTNLNVENKFLTFLFTCVLKNDITNEFGKYCAEEIIIYATKDGFSIPLRVPTKIPFYFRNILRIALEDSLIPITYFSLFILKKSIKFIILKVIKYGLKT
jgi:hypothetical protein